MDRRDKKLNEIKSLLTPYKDRSAPAEVIDQVIALIDRNRRRRGEDVEHGRSKYVNQGCRCDVCRKACATYQKERRLKTQGGK